MAREPRRVPAVIAAREARDAAGARRRFGRVRWRAAGLLLLGAMALAGCIDAGYLKSPTTPATGVAVITRSGDDYIYLIRYRGLDQPLASVTLQQEIGEPLALPIGPSPLVGTVPVRLVGETNPSEPLWDVSLVAGTDAARIELGGRLVSFNLSTAGERTALLNALGEVFEATLLPNGDLPPFGVTGGEEATAIIDIEARVISLVVPHPELSSPLRTVSLNIGLPGDGRRVAVGLAYRAGALLGRLDEATLVAAGVAGGFDQAAAAIRSGHAFVDVTTDLVPRGELRGILAPYAVTTADLGFALSTGAVAALAFGIGVIVLAFFVAVGSLRQWFTRPGIAGRSFVADPALSPVIAFLVVAVSLVLLPDGLALLLGRMGPLDPEWTGLDGAMPFDRMVTFILAGAAAGLIATGREGWLAAMAGAVAAGLVAGLSMQLSGESAVLIRTVGALGYYGEFALFYGLPALFVTTLAYTTVRVLVAPSLLGERGPAWRADLLVGVTLLLILVLAALVWANPGIATVIVVAGAVLVIRRRAIVQERPDRGGASHP